MKRSAYLLIILLVVIALTACSNSGSSSGTSSLSFGIMLKGAPGAPSLAPITCGGTTGISTVEALLYDRNASVAVAAIAAAGALGVGELVPDLVALIKKSTRGDGARQQRLRVVRALGRLGGEQAAAALRELLTVRISLFPGETKRFRAEVRRMLNRIAEKQTSTRAQGNPAPAASP